MIIVLMQTLLPDPVAPAIKRCGNFVMSITITSPERFFPRATASGDVSGTEFMALNNMWTFYDRDFFIRDFDSDGRFSRNWCLDSHALCSQRHGNVIRKVHDFADPNCPAEACEVRNALPWAPYWSPRPLLRYRNRRASFQMCRIF